MKRLFLPLVALALSAGPAFAQSVDCSQMSTIATADTGAYASCRPAGLVSDKPVDPDFATRLFGAPTPGFGINLRAGSPTPRGFISFTAETPATVTPILATTDNFYAGDYAGDDFTKVYATLSLPAPSPTTPTPSPELYSINTATGARTLIATTSLPAGTNPLDMAWDYTTSTMYLTAGAGAPTVTSLYKLNLTTGVATLVAPVTGSGFGTGINLLAHPFTGVLYAVDLASDVLYSINKTTGAATSIGAIGVNISFAQGADFDNATGTAYLCAYEGGGVNTLRTVDLITGVSASVGSFNMAEVDICAIGTARGTAPTGPILTAGPANVTFGATTQVGTTSAPQTVTLSNPGTSPVTITSITGSGAPFTVSTAGTTLTIAPGASTTFTVTFSPTNTTAATGTVTIVSNAPDSPTVINLTGTGFVPPPNDNRANATVITAPGTITGTNVNATLETGEAAASCQASSGASVWWSYTPATTGSVDINLSATGFDTVLTLYLADGTEVACDDDSGSVTFTSRLRTSVTAGTTYLIRVAGFGTAAPATGAISFTLTAGPALLSSSISGTTVGGPTYNRPFINGGTCGPSGVGTAVFYRAIPFTPASNGLFELRTDFTGGQPGTFILYNGPFNPATPCANAVLTSSSSPAVVLVDLIGGTTYTAVVAGFENTDVGTYTLTAIGPEMINFMPVASEGSATDARTFLSASPNPARGAARVRFASATAQTVTVSVYDVTGRQVATLFQGAVSADQQMDLALNAASLAPGVYVVRATGTDLNLTQRVTVVR